MIELTAFETKAATDTMVDLTIIIVNWNTKNLLLQTISSVYANLPGSYRTEIIVVDNGSSDGSQSALQEAFPQVQLIANKDNRGFGPANNQGLIIAKGRYSLLLNSDVIVQPDSLEKIIAFMDEHPKVGLCGIQILNPDGSFQGSYADYLSLRGEFLILSAIARKYFNPHYPSYPQAESQETKMVDTIQGAFMFARTEALRAIGWLDEQFFMYGEENDLSLSLKRHGWEVYYLADVTIIHLGGQSSRKNWTKMVWQLQKSKVLLFRKHYGRIYAFAFKLLVSFIVLTKFTIFQLKKLIKLESSSNNWFHWVNFQEFWAV